jgi:predicted amidohydrolase YtcJ
MASKWKVILIVCLAAGAVATLVCGQESIPDLILFNGKIFTSDVANPYVQALAIRGERIVATGDTDKIKALAGPRTKQIDLAGRTVIPGINDAHIHLEIQPASSVELQFEGPNPVWGQVKQAIVSAVAKAPKGTIVLGQIGPAIFFDEMVNRDLLDQVAPEHPVILTTFTGHASILNGAALAKFGYTEHEKDPLGGRIERFADGRLTGVIREYAGFQISRKLGEITSDSDAKAEINRTLVEANRLGITSLQDMSGSISPERCVKLFASIPTPIRVRVIRMPGTTSNSRSSPEGRPLPTHPTTLVSVSGTKWLIDGVPLENTFESRHLDRSRPPKSVEEGMAELGMTFPETELSKILQETLKSSDQLLLHVSGYPAPAAVLAEMQAAGGKNVWYGKRVRFEHGDGLLPDLLPRVREYGIVVVQNPAHLAVRAVLPQLFHDKGLEKGQALASLLAAGIPVALGSDGQMNPYLNIMFASTHPDRPSEAITREQAVIAYTLTSAYAEFAEKDKGSLEPGKLADLAVLSQDIFGVHMEELPKTQSVLTLVGGKTVYDAGVVH